MIKFLTFLSIIYLYILVTRFFFNKLKNKALRNTIGKYISILTKCLKVANDKVNIMELNDRYVINTDLEVMDQFGAIKLFKGEKKILISDQYIDLTNKEYEDILELIKPKL